MPLDSEKQYSSGAETGISLKHEALQKHLQEETQELLEIIKENPDLFAARMNQVLISAETSFGSEPDYAAQIEAIVEHLIESGQGSKVPSLLRAFERVMHPSVQTNQVEMGERLTYLRDRLYKDPNAFREDYNQTKEVYAVTELVAHADESLKAAGFESFDAVLEESESNLDRAGLEDMIEAAVLFDSRSESAPHQAALVKLAEVCRKIEDANKTEPNFPENILPLLQGAIEELAAVDESTEEAAEDEELREAA
ncbi:hypothetical protein N9L26_00520 [Candidatus Pacebacteria bacterium]|nr:hypothetical protein [Candidatus Paceibacterota bacterium]